MSSSRFKGDDKMIISADTTRKNYIESIRDDINKFLREAIHKKERTLVYHRLPYESLEYIGIIKELQELGYLIKEYRFGDNKTVYARIIF